MLRRLGRVETALRERAELAEDGIDEIGPGRAMLRKLANEDLGDEDEDPAELARIAEAIRLVPARETPPEARCCHRGLLLWLANEPPEHECWQEPEGFARRST